MVDIIIHCKVFAVVLYYGWWQSEMSHFIMYIYSLSVVQKHVTIQKASFLDLKIGSFIEDAQIGNLID